MGLAISSVVQNGGIVKAGTGTLALLNPSNSFAGGITLSAGGLMLGNGGAGVGTFTINGGTTLIGAGVSGVATTVGNPVVINGSFTIGGDEPTVGTGNTNFNDSLILAGPVTLGTSVMVTTTSPYVLTTINAGISDGGHGYGFGINGLGTLVLGPATYNDVPNSWSGPTTINGGYLRMGYAAAIPSTSSVRIGAGVLNLNGFSETIGSLADSVGGGTGGGIMNQSATIATLTVGADNTSTSYSGTIYAFTPANFALTKIGSGQLTMTGTSTYTGATTVTGGVLDELMSGATPALPTGSPLGLGTGGVLQSNGPFAITRTLAATQVAAANTITWLAGGGGFAARGGILTVNIGGNATPTTEQWGTTAGFVLNGDPLVFGSATADNLVDWLNPIQLTVANSATQTIQVNRGTGTVDAQIDGAITETSGKIGSLTKTGSGILVLTSTGSNYSGNTTISAGTLRMDGTILSNGAGSLTTVAAGATLAGTGTVTGPVTVTGSLSPGDAAIGTLKTGPLTLQSAATTNILLGHPGTDHSTNLGNSSMVSVIGASSNLTLNAGTTLQLFDNANAGGLGTVGPGTYKIFTYTGTQSGTFTVNDPWETVGPSSLHYKVTYSPSVYLDLYGLATGTVAPAPITLAPVHVNSPTLTSYLTITNTASAGYYESLDASFGTTTGAGISNNGGAVNYLPPTNSDSSHMSVLIDASTAQNISGSVQVFLNSDGFGSSGYGQMGIATISVPVTGAVYSGQGVWAASGSGTWTPIVNWSMVGPVPGGVPGIDGSYSIGDTATFSSAVSSGLASIDLVDQSPHVASVTFDNNSASYQITRSGNGSLHLDDGGTNGVSVTVTSGSHEIAVPVVLHGNLLATINGTSLTVSQPISENSAGLGLTLSGTGTLILSATNTYSGPTTVSQGNLAVNGMLQNSAVEVQPTGTLSGSGTVSNDVTLTGGTVNLATGGAILGNLNVNAGGAWNGLGSVGLVAQVNTGTLAVNGTLPSSTPWWCNPPARSAAAARSPTT